VLEELHAVLDFSRDIYRGIPFFFLESAVKDNRLTKAEAMTQLNALTVEFQQRAARVGINGGKIEAAIAAFTRENTRTVTKLVTKDRKVTTSRTSKSEPPRRAKKRSAADQTLSAAIQTRRGEIEAKLSEIPASIGKTENALAFDIRREPKSDDPPDALCAFGPDARGRFKESVAERRQALLGGDLMGASARRGWETFWYVQYMRYVEAFEPIDGRDLLLAECEAFKSEFREKAASVLVWKATTGEHTVYELPVLLEVAWSYSRCRALRHFLFPIARRIVRWVLQWQRPDGAWPAFDYSAVHKTKHPKLYPDPETTAQAVIFLSIFGRAPEIETAIEKASKWLIEAQREDGLWRRHGKFGWPLLTTLLVLDALRRSSTPIDHPSIARGEAALFSLQKPTGHWWEEECLWPSYISSLAVEYFQVRTHRGTAQNSYLTSARALLIKAEQMVLAEDDGDASLATAAAYHGVEHFLYGCILELNADESIQADNKGTTIGLGEALSAMERALKKKGLLEQHSGLPYRVQLKQLGSKRDMFIHRAEPVMKRDAISYVSTCRAFVERFDVPILGARLCD
jgi:hypothetical protein